MLQSAFNYGRLLARAVVAGLTSENQRFSNQFQQKPNAKPVHFISAVSGFSKTAGSARSHLQSKWCYGEDAYFISQTKTASVIGVADGVGGWREYGVDPSQVPKTIMTLCTRLLEKGKFHPAHPKQLLQDAYEEASMVKDEVIGSTTACILSLNKYDSKVHAANLGDSGYMVVRDGKVLARSQEQQHYFNTPFQLTLVPPAYRDRVLSNSPSEADTHSIDVLDGDIIVLATDGLFDNMTDSMILSHLRIIQHKRCETVQSAADKIASEALKLSNDPEYSSPFAKAAASNGYHMKGGKPDDITVIVATVNSGELAEFCEGDNR